MALEELIVAYTNEVSTERLLPYNSIADEFNQMMRNVHIDQSATQVVRTLKELEIERIRFFVKSYVLARLQKLNSNVFLSADLMSAREAVYYRKHMSLLEKNGVLTDKKSPTPEYVGFYCVKNLESVKIDDDVVEIFEGDFFVANIDDVIEYLNKGYIVLA